MTTQINAHAAPTHGAPNPSVPVSHVGSDHSAPPARPMGQYARPQTFAHHVSAPAPASVTPSAPKPKWHSSVWTLGLVSVAATLGGLSIPENGTSAWNSVHAWGGLAVLGALLTLAPVALGNLTRQRAWQVSACGAGALVLFWVLFTLPSVGSNTSLAVTIGVAAGAIAAWIVPGREGAESSAPRRDEW